PSVRAVVGARVTQSPLRLASSARPSRGSSSTHRRTGHATANRGGRRRSDVELMIRIGSREHSRRVGRARGEGRTRHSVLRDRTRFVPPSKRWPHEGFRVALQTGATNRKVRRRCHILGEVTKRVLIVDDEAPVVEVLKDFFRQFRHENTYETESAKD